jgi:hypothetical protein
MAKEQCEGVFSLAAQLHGRTLRATSLAHLRYKCLLFLMENLKRLWQKRIWRGQAKRRECCQTALLNSMTLLFPVGRKVRHGVAGREPRLL